jgi:hypothetical protein
MEPYLHKKHGVQFRQQCQYLTFSQRAPPQRYIVETESIGAADVSQYTDRMSGRKLIQFPTKTEFLPFPRALEQFWGPKHLSAQATERGNVTL